MFRRGMLGLSVLTMYSTLMSGCSDISDKICPLDDLKYVSYSMALFESYPEVDLSKVTELPIYLLSKYDANELHRKLYQVADSLGIEEEPKITCEYNHLYPPVVDDWETLAQMPASEVEHKFAPSYKSSFIRLTNNLIQQESYAYDNTGNEYKACAMLGIDFTGFKFDYDNDKMSASVDQLELERLCALGENYIEEHKDILANVNNITKTTVHTNNGHFGHYSVCVKLNFREEQFTEPRDILLDFCSLKKGVDINFTCQDNLEIIEFKAISYPADNFALVDTVKIIPYETAKQMFDKGDVNYEGDADINSTCDYDIYLFYVVDNNNYIRPVYLKQENGRIGDFTDAAWIDAISY